MKGLKHGAGADRAHVRPDFLLGGDPPLFASISFVLAQTLTGTVRGIEGYLVRVEVDLSKGVPAFLTVGLPDTTIREAKDRVRAALRNSGFDVPQRRITINLAPADIKKQGSAFDLAVAVGLVAAGANGDFSPRLGNTLLLGELALDGNVRPVRGVLPVAAEAKRRGFKTAFVPRANSYEAALVRGLSVYPVDSLSEAVDLLQRGELPDPLRTAEQPMEGSDDLVDLAEVKGQYAAKRALEIAAAGGHNLLFSGPPGSGKTLLARRMPSILPKLSFEEALEVTKVHSVAGKLNDGRCLVIRPPFRAPHHTVSWAAMAGGGAGPMPGEVALAHRGLLFLDELPEFHRNALEALRQPLEEGSIAVSRVSGAVVFPARFMLVAAMNPCPCGYLGAETRPCACTPLQIRRYRSKISGPLLDRIDLHVFVRPLDAEQLLGHGEGESSASVRQRVSAARQVQEKRFRRTRTRVNAHMRPRQIPRYCPLDPGCRTTIRRAIRRLGLSARAYHRVVKVARTIADLAGSEHIEDAHLREAIQYRVLETPSDGST